jgi:hypothetical protein
VPYGTVRERDRKWERIKEEREIGRERNIERKRERGKEGYRKRERC